MANASRWDDTKHELAERMGTTQSVISRLEEGGGARMSTTLENWSVATISGNHPVTSARFLSVVDRARRLATNGVPTLLSSNRGAVNVEARVT